MLVRKPIGQLPFASWCDFTWVPELEEFFMGPFRFSIDQVMYQEEIEKGTGSLVCQQRVAFLEWVRDRLCLIHLYVEFLK